MARLGESSLDPTGLARECRAMLARGDLSPGDRADAFELLHRRAGLAFLGVEKLPPGTGYVDVFEQQAAAYLALHEAIDDADAPVDVAGLLDAVKRSHARDSIRAASALLLAAIVDPAAAQPIVAALLEPGRLSRAEVPPIALHSAAHAVVLIGDDALREQLARLASVVPFEESREDALCGALVGTPAPGPRETAAAFIRAAVAAPRDDGLDMAGHTALVLLRRRTDPATFAALLDELAAAPLNDSTRAALETYRNGEPPRGGMTEPPGEPRLLIKLWDGFTVTHYDDGARIQWGDAFSDFIDY